MLLASSHSLTLHSLASGHSLTLHSLASGHSLTLRAHFIHWLPFIRTCYALRSFFCFHTFVRATHFAHFPCLRVWNYCLFMRASTAFYFGLHSFEKKQCREYLYHVFSFFLSPAHSIPYKKQQNSPCAFVFLSVCTALKKSSAGNNFFIFLCLHPFTPFSKR